MYLPFLIILLFGPFANAQAPMVLLRDSELPIWKFQGIALVHGGKSFAQVQWEERQEAAKASNLTEEIERLKIWKTAGRDAEVFAACSKMTAGRYDFDWPEFERESISWCLREMARSVTLAAQNSSLQQEARIFSGKVKSSDLTTVELDPTLAKNYELILVNGREIKISAGTVKVPSFKSRITLLSSSHFPISEYMDAGQLRNMKLSSSALLLGTCADGYTLSPNQFSNQELTFKGLGSDCEYVINPSPKPLRPAALAKSFTPAPQGQPFWKSHWVWIGVGGALVYYLANQHENGSAPPSTKQGF